MDYVFRPIAVWPVPLPVFEVRDVPGFPGYRVGDDGSVWSCFRRTSTGRGGIGTSTASFRWRRLKPGIDKADRPCVVCRRDGKPYVRRVCRLVLEAFVGPRPAGMEACHFPDRDPTNNRLENLRWDTRAANSADARVHGTWAHGERSGRAKLTEAQVIEIRRLVAAGWTRTALATRFKVTRRTIRLVAIGVSWKYLIGADGDNHEEGHDGGG